MPEQAKPVGYNCAQITLHWLVAALLPVSFFSHDAMQSAWRAVRRGAGAEPGWIAQVHIWVGLTILVLVLIRLAIRLSRGAPEAPADTPKPMAWIARPSHWLIYAVLIALPATGLAAWFLGIHIAGDLHGLLFTIGWILIALHTGAALLHQYVLKDRLISRMMRPN